ncbi:serpin family protein [Planktothrix sp. FACHB-1365]|uniref:serpin family protein n=1 Tax=Planktothrix sp. FACHB-1365 TaxID=2692855 RepID=UPI0016850ACC|nr:serpin family protein [Planktothrix sp. FACHB-1365]MBD2481708.1 serpin family protein [Planktothrix sp. FACHB-1365]
MATPIPYPNKSRESRTKIQGLKLLRFLLLLSIPTLILSSSLINPVFQQSSYAQTLETKVSPRVKEMANRNNIFALNFYQTLQGTEGNLFFSPYSISTAFAMTYAGARGQTEQQIAQVFGFSPGEEFHVAFSDLERQLKAGQQSDDVLLLSANSLYPQIKYPFLESFLALLDKYYQVKITAVDYEKDPQAARNTINQWVAEQTRNKINELIPPNALNNLTRLVLVNAVYFKGNWAIPFDKNLTKTEPFWVTPSRRIQVPMMQQKKRVGYTETEEVQVLELPYVGNNLSLIILLPRKINGLTELEKKLTVENLSNWIESVDQQNVEVSLPRFQVNFQSELSNTLAQMGVTDAFNQDNANFSGMDGQENWLSIKKVFHQAFIDVNEEGSEATAATGVSMGVRSRPPSFEANHPFIFLIRENHTGNIMFLGRLVNPEI